MSSPRSVPVPAGIHVNRDISWLSFNQRVLDEAADAQLPLFERLKFLAIYSSNLDEFYRVRVAMLKHIQDLNNTADAVDKDPTPVLDEINRIVELQLDYFGYVLRKLVIPALRKEGIVLNYHKKDIPHRLLKEITDYFRSKVLGYLQPVIFHDSREIFLENRLLYLVLKVTHKVTGELSYATVNVPNELPRFYYGSGRLHYVIFLDDVIRTNLRMLFPGYNISEAFSVKLNRNADLRLDDELGGDLVEKIKSSLKRRKVGVPSRLLYDAAMPLDMVNAIMFATRVRETDLSAGGRYHNLHDLATIRNPLYPRLSIKQWKQIRCKTLDDAPSILDHIEKKDELLHIPYHSYDYVLRFFNEAAVDPYVTEIHATFYRVAADSFIVNSLISAAKNGKKVFAFIEVKARFDEENNLQWAKKMDEAGVVITYSMPNLKVHAKAALVIRKKSGFARRLAYLATGNFNERTAAYYADHGLFTTHTDLTADLRKVFMFLQKKKPINKLHFLLVSPFNLRTALEERIDREIANVKAGGTGQMTIKVNNLEDASMVTKLYEASMAGVEVVVLVRGICTLSPQTKPVSDNIKVLRLVDRYLEHSRIFVFHNNGNKEVFLGSADWMVRNLSERVEVVFPVLDQNLKVELIKYLAYQIHDNSKLRILDQDHVNHFILRKHGKPVVRAQYHIHNWLSHLSGE